MKEISSLTENGFQCPYRDEAWCTTKCGNHKYVFSTEKGAGIEIFKKQLGELIGNLIRERMIDGSFKEIDCRPTLPESQ